MSYNHNMMMRPNPRDILPPRQLHSVLGPKNMNVVQNPVTFNHVRMQAPQSGQVMGPRFYGFNTTPAYPYESYKTKPGRMGFSAASTVSQAHREYKPSTKQGHPTTFVQTSPVKASVATFKSNTLLVGQTYNVTCCIVENGPCLFSVHLESEIEELNTMMNELENESLKNISERPSIGMACIARFSEDGNLYRAVIMSIKPTACQVAYVDYGNTELVSFANLYEIPPTYLKHKIFAIRFALSGYKDLEPIDDSMKNLFKNMVFQKRLTLKVMPLEGPPLVQYCELWDNKINILEALKLYKNKKLTYGPTQPISQNDIVVITFVESPKKFFVQSVKNIPAFDNLMDELFLHCRKSKDMVTRYVKGTACAVKFENAWYRAEIIGENSSRVHIRHVDFGNERSVDKNQLYAINEKLVEFPPQAVHCCLKGFENADSLSDSATVQLEMLAETSDNERRHFKCNVMDQQLSSGAILVNLIDDTIRPELNLMKRLFRLSMPFNTYIGLEKEMSSSATSAHVNVNAQAKSVANVPMNGDHLYVQQQAHQAERSTEWEMNSSGSSDMRDTAASPSSSQGRRGHSGSIRGGHKENKQRDNYNSYKTKSIIPPRFQKQKIENKGNKENNQQNLYSKQNSSSDSGKFSQNTRSTARRDVSTSNSYRAPSPTPDVIEIHEYLPFDAGLPEQAVPVPSRKDVIVCWWISPHQFYVHQKSRIPDFENMMKRIQAFYKTIPTTEITPSVGSHIIARYKEDKILYRARVLACNAKLGKYRVLFIDFGNQSTVDADDIWAMEKRFSVLPIMCQLCSFDEVVANYDHKYITTRVEKYLTPKANLVCNFQRKENELYFVDIDVNGKSLKESLIGDGTLSSLEKDVEVELLLGQQIKAKMISVKDLLNFQIEIEGCDLKLMCSYNDIKLIRSNPHLSSDFKLGYEEKVCVIDIVDVSKEKILMLQPIIPLFTHDIPPEICDYPIVSRSFNVKVSYIKNENILFVSPSALENTLYELVDNMFNYYEEGGEVMDNIKVGDVCAAKSSDENWYRARVIAVSKKKESYEVFYIDYGNTEIITELNRIKKLEGKFCDLSALSIRIYLPLKSIKENDEAVIKEIKSLTDGCELNLKVLESYKKRWIVDILSEDYSLVDYLTDKSLISGKDIQYVKNIIDNEKNLIDVTLKDSVRDLSKNVEVTPKVAAAFPADQDEIEEAADEGVAPADAKDIKSYTEEYDDSMENMTEAYLSHCDNPGRFFLQLASNYSELTKLQDNLQIVAGSLPLLTTYTDGALCIALYSVDETWYRAKIIDSEIMVIQFIDYGNTDVITDNSYIKEMNEAFANIEPFAIQCALPIAPKDTVDWVDEANNVFNEIYDKTVYFDYITKGEQKNYVHLKVEGADISEKLVKNNMARSLEILPSGENCFVSHINNLSDFYVQMECDSNGLELIADHLAGYETFPVEDEYKEGTICAAIFPDDSEWYRAKILSRENDETNVLFIDYGNTSITPEARKISPEIANLPFLSKKCSLRMPDYILGWSDAAEAKFTELSAMGQTVFTIKLVEPGDHAVVDLYIEDRNIIDELEKLCDKRPQQIVREIGKTPKKEKTEERVRKEICVSHVNSPLEFYVQLEGEGSEIESITNELASASEYKKLEKHETDTICAAVYPVDGAYYRARILSQDNRGTHVNFIDFGNTAISKDLRILPDALKAKKPYARLCSLDDQDIDFTTQEAIDIFNCLLGDGSNMECEVTREIQSLWIVKLYKDKKDLAVELAKELKEKNPIQEEEKTEKKTEEAESTIEQTPAEPQETINVMVSHVNSHTDFYIQLESENDTLDTMLDELAKAEEFEKFENYSVGDLCAAVFVDDGAFYRAKIISKSAEDCEVLFIDYGNCAASGDIRKLPKHLDDITALAKHCSLEKNADYDENVDLSNEHFSSLVTSHFGETFQVKVVEKGSDLWTIQLFYNNLNIGSELAKLVKEAEQSKSEEEVWSTLKDQSKASSEVDTSAAFEEEATTEFSEENPVKIPAETLKEKTVQPTTDVSASSLAKQKTESAMEPEAKSSTEVVGEKAAAEEPSQLESSTDTATEEGANVTTESIPAAADKGNDSKENTQESKTENCKEAMLGEGENKSGSQWSDTRDANESFNEDVVIAVIEPANENPPAAEFSVENDKNLSSEELGNSLWAGLHSLGIADRAVSASETNLSKRTNNKTDTSSATNVTIPNNEDVSKSCINLH